MDFSNGMSYYQDQIEHKKLGYETENRFSVSFRGNLWLKLIKVTANTIREVESMTSQYL